MARKLTAEELAKATIYQIDKAQLAATRRCAFGCVDNIVRAHRIATDALRDYGNEALERANKAVLAIYDDLHGTEYCRRQGGTDEDRIEMRGRKIGVESCMKAIRALKEKP